MRVTASDVDINELDGTITSLFFFRFKLSNDISIASVPFATPRQYFELTYCENFFSNLVLISPPINVDLLII